jgi:hypothetical protein
MQPNCQEGTTDQELHFELVYQHEPAEDNAVWSICERAVSQHSLATDIARIVSNREPRRRLTETQETQESSFFVVIHTTRSVHDLSLRELLEAFDEGIYDSQLMVVLVPGHLQGLDRVAIPPATL